MKASRNDRRRRRHIRVRRKISGTAALPRLVIYRSLRYLYAQVIDDSTGHTLFETNTYTKAKLAGQKCLKNLAAAKELGQDIANLCKEKNINSVVFDRGGNLFHGRVKAVAEGAKAAGLKI